MRRVPFKKTISGVVVMGHFPKGNEWMFVPDSKNEQVLHSPSLDVFVVCLRKRAEDVRVDLVYNKLPQKNPIINHSEVRTRRLSQQELANFESARGEIRRIHAGKKIQDLNEHSMPMAL